MPAQVRPQIRHSRPSNYVEPGKEWRLLLYLTENDPDTTARVILDTGDHVLASHAEAHRNPRDMAVPEVGDELAAGRALVSLGQRLIRGAASDIEAFDSGG